MKPSTNSLTAEIKEQKTKLGFWARWKRKRDPAHSYLVTIFYSNGTGQTLIIKTHEEFFTHRKRTYHLNEKCGRQDLTNGIQHFYFDEDVTEPINLLTIKQGNAKFFSVTPDNIAPIIRMEYVKALASAQELNKYLKNVQLLSIISVFLMIVNVYVTYKGFHP